MRDRLRAPIEKARDLRKVVGRVRETRLEHFREHHLTLRELAALAVRSLRRRKLGDDHPLKD